MALCLEKPLGGRVVQRLGHVLSQQPPMLIVPELLSQEGLRKGKQQARPRDKHGLLPTMRVGAWQGGCRRRQRRRRWAELRGKTEALWAQLRRCESA